MPFRIKIFLSIFLALLILMLLGPFLLPRTEPEGTSARSSLIGPEGRFVEAGGVSLHVIEAGDGPTNFLLLHGYPANAESWRGLLPELALYGRAVAFDRPGFGLSERPLPGSWRRGENPYLPDAQTQQAIALLDELEIERAVWIGSSSGALTALETALEFPDRLSGLVLIGAPVYGTRAPPAWLRPLLYTPQMDRIGPLLMRQLGGAPGMSLFASQWADPERIDQSDIDAYRRTFEVDEWDRSLWEVSKASRESNLEMRLGEVEVEVLVVTGAEDEIVPPSESERLARELPNATLALMEGCGHLPHEECSAEFMEVLSSWLAR